MLPRPLVNVAEVTPEKFSTPTVQLITSQTPESLNLISPNFYRMYRNDYRSLLWNQNCDIPHRFGTPECQMKVCCQINSVNFEIIERKLTKFLHAVAGLLPFNFLKAASRSSNPLSNARAESKGRSWQRLQTAPTVAIATSLERLPNEC